MHIEMNYHKQGTKRVDNLSKGCQPSIALGDKY